jgi:hypothetical protein
VSVAVNGSRERENFNNEGIAVSYRKGGGLMDLMG